MPFDAMAAYGIYRHRCALSDVLKTLNQGGFSNEKICMMLSPTHPIGTVVREANALNTDRQASAVTAGLIGWLSEFGAVVIPTVGFFIRSQEFFRAIITETEPVLRCGSSRTLEVLGFPENEAERLQYSLDQGGALVYVSCPESAKTQWALELLRGTGAEEAGIVQGLEDHDAVAAIDSDLPSAGRSEVPIPLEA
jgi:hypothetical protein